MNPALKLSKNLMLSSGSTACDTTIRNMVKRVARRIFSEGDLELNKVTTSFSLPITQKSVPEYYQLERFLDREEYHARLQTYINAGSVQAEWDRSAGARGQLARVTMIDPSSASDLLGIDLPWKVAAKAIADLEAVMEEGLPAIDQITEAWRYGKAPGGITANKSKQFIDSMRVIKAAKQLGGNSRDILLRRVSAQLFGNTKRIEALARQVAFLLGNSADSDDESVFARLGLVKHPQPLLISGPPSCCITVTEGKVPLVKPYVGLRPDTIEGVVEEKMQIRQVLTIENLASFNEAAQHLTNPSDLLIIYVAGNPTPSLLFAYKRLLGSIKPLTVRHWGDIDVGGFRIASRLAESAKLVGYQLQLWRMLSTDIPNDQKCEANDLQIKEIAAICNQHGWTNELEGLTKAPYFQEQEFIEWSPPVANQI